METVFDVEALQRAARLAGFAWSDADLRALCPAVENARRLLATLETVPLYTVEPTTQYRIL